MIQHYNTRTQLSGTVKTTELMAESTDETPEGRRDGDEDGNSEAIR